MRAIQFMKIDFIKTKQQILWMLLVIPAVLLLMLREIKGEMALIVFCYALFMALVFSTAPFGMCQHRETGFLLLLPASTRDRVHGRFLYGLSFLGIAVLLGSAGMYLCEAITGFGIEREVKVCFGMVAFSVCMVFMIVEYVFLYLFGEQQSQNILSLVRMIPGFVFFFGSMGLIGGVQKEPQLLAEVMEYIDGHLILIGWCSMAVSFILFTGAASLCAAVTKKKDFG